MSNLRVIYDNAADRATLSSSAVAASLPVTNLKSDLKSKVCRSTSTTFTLTLTWSSPVLLAGFVAAFTTLTATHTIQAVGYTNTSDTTPAFDTGAILGGAGAQPVNANSFAYGGGTYSRVWFPKAAVTKLVVTFIDANNTQGYIDIGRVICGDYWAPGDTGVEIGSTVSMEDTSTHYRTDGGDLITYVGTKHKKQSFSLPSLSPTDRAAFWNILWRNGMARSMFISLYPDNADPAIEQTHSLYGRLSASPAMKSAYWRYWSATVDIEEI